MERRNVILTGASRGIGEHIANALAARNMNLLLVARSGEELARVAESVRAHGTLVAFEAVDLAEPDAPQRVVEAAAREFGGVVDALGAVSTRSRRRRSRRCYGSTSSRRSRSLGFFSPRCSSMATAES